MADWIWSNMVKIMVIYLQRTYWAIKYIKQNRFQLFKTTNCDFHMDSFSDALKKNRWPDTQILTNNFLAISVG